jgi:excisionase family DNA binding protein
VAGLIVSVRCQREGWLATAVGNRPARRLARVGTDVPGSDDRLTLDEAAALLGVSKTTVSRMVRAGILQSAGGRYQRRPVWREEAERLGAELSRSLTFEEAAAMLGISHWTVWELMHQGG